MDDKRLSKKITLKKDYFELDKEQQNIELERLNKEVIKKYENKYSIYNLDEEQLKEIQTEIDDKLPTNVRFQEFYDGLYIVFNKKIGENRMSTTSKLPHNYNINKELHLLNTRIIDKYGEENGLSLEKFPYDENDDKIEIPEGVYISLKCKKPYIFMKQDKQTISVTLPEKYNLKEQIELFTQSKTQNYDNTHNIEEVKQMFADGIKPDNISICFKENKYYQLQYKLKTKENRHDKSFTMPKENININLELIKMNEYIITKYGKEFAILLC